MPRCCLALNPSLGRYAEAERRFKEAIDEARAGFPANDPHIPSALHYLAEFYRNMGRLDEAEPLYRQVCGVRRQGQVDVPLWQACAASCCGGGVPPPASTLFIPFPLLLPVWHTDPQPAG